MRHLANKVTDSAQEIRTLLDLMCDTQRCNGYVYENAATGTSLRNVPGNSTPSYRFLTRKRSRIAFATPSSRPDYRMRPASPICIQTKSHDLFVTIADRRKLETTRCQGAHCVSISEGLEDGEVRHKVSHHFQEFVEQPVALPTFHFDEFFVTSQ